MTINKTNSTFKLIIVGNEGVGKTTFINRHKSGEFLKSPTPTKATSLSFKTNRGKFTFNVYDSSEDYSNAQCALLFFDVSNRESYNSLSDWYRKIREACPDIPIVICRNKVDLRETQVKQSDITFHKKYFLPYFNVSAKSNYNFEKPFLHLLRKLRNDEKLQLSII